MPLFSKNFVDFIIEPTWKLIISLQSFYLEQIISDKEMIFSQEELNIMQAENHNYSRGYESDDEEETYGLEGLVKELIKFLIVSLENNQVMKKLKNYLPMFLISIKNYCIITNETYSLSLNDPCNFVSDVYNDLDCSSLRFSSMKLVKSIMNKIDYDNVFCFIKAIISEFKNDPNNNVYSPLVMFDNSKNLGPLIKNLNENSDYIMRKCEANLFLIGTIINNLKILIKKKKLDFEKIKEILFFLHGLLQAPKSILSDRAIWCIGKISEIFVNEKSILIENFYFIANFFISLNNNLISELISSKCLKEIADLILIGNKEEKIIESNFVISIINRNIRLFQLSSEETINIPIESIIAISKLNKQSALADSSNLINLVLETYLKYYNETNISRKLIQLIELWSSNQETEKQVFEFFIPLLLHLTDEYFSRLSMQISIQNYLDIRKTLSIQIIKPQIKINTENIPV